MREDVYAPVNALWSALGVGWRSKRLTEARVARIAQHLWTHAECEGMPHMIHWHTWMRWGIKRLVHDLAHQVWREKRKPGDRRDHCWEEASWERALATEAIRRGWHLLK